MNSAKTHYSFAFKDYVLIFIVLTSLISGFITISVWMSRQDIESKFVRRSQAIHHTLLQRLNNIDAALISLAGLGRSIDTTNNKNISDHSLNIIDNFNFVDAVYIADKQSFKSSNQIRYTYPLKIIEPYSEKTTALTGVDFNSNNRYESEISHAGMRGKIVHTRVNTNIYKTQPHYFLLKAIYSGYLKPATALSRKNQLKSLAIIQINLNRLIPDFITFYGKYHISIKNNNSNFISTGEDKNINTPFWNTKPLVFSIPLQVHDNKFELVISKNYSVDEFINKKLYSAIILSASISLMLIALLRSLRKSQYRQKIAQEKLFDQQEKARITLTSIGDAVISTDIHGRIEFINNAAEQLLGYTLNEVYGKAFSQTFILVDENDPESVKKPVEFCLTHPEAGNISETAMLLHHNGTPISINTNAASIHNSNNQLTGVVLVLRDISQERKLVRKIAHQATHDELTGLTNRRGFEVQLQYAIDNRRSSSAKYSFCYIDLDEFKVVNDTCGHTAGDELLKLISAKIKKHIRKDDVLARLGGDEFGILLTNCEIDVAEKIAHSIRKEVKNTQFVWDSKLFTVGASIGLFFIDRQTESITDVLSAADSACYIAKERGRDAVHIYTPDDKAIAEHIGLMQWPTRIRSALKNQNFVLYKQLIAPTNPAKNKPVTEFLIRLKSDDGDLIPPMAFIPAAERYNLMHEIDCWVIKHAIEEIESLGDSNMLYSINLSGQSLGKPQLYNYIASNITQTGINPNQLCFEITETAAITNQESALALITQLKKLGCLFALDDFGTGLSSFSYLKTLPVDILKIDGVFIRNMVTDRIDQSLVKAINHIGHELNLKTIAEWVETEESKSLLTNIGVDYLQGYYIEEPVIASIFSSETG